MANCRTYMRGLCISFNVLLLMFGVLMIVVGFTSSIKHPTELEYWTNTHGVYLLKIFGPITVFLSVLGAYAAVTDRKPVLILYAVLMSIMFIALITIAAPLIGVQSQLDQALKELFKSAVPLHTAEPQFQTELKKLQTTDACCGLQNYTDWGEQVPASCLCAAAPAPTSTPSHNATFAKALEQ
ncbi:23 kDa integral membrane protein-like [Aplochiton taeniatus]